MGLRGVAREVARGFAAPRPFVVSAADGTADRLAVEAELRRRGWRPALSPAETGTLVVCGTPGAALAEAVETVWRDMPEPRVRASADLEGVEGPPRAPLELDDVPMADRADDRDGLRLDVLHVPLGPVLADWPAGLRVDLVLQGDVVQDAEATAVDTADGSFWRGRPAASRLDGLARLLRVAGWDAAAERAAVLRDDALSGAVPDRTLARRFRPFARGVGRSRLLRWMTRDVGGVRETLDTWLRDVGAALEGRDVPPRPPWRAALDALPASLAGRELGEARLIVASLDPDLGTAADG
ncbi:hypothetical protein [Actinomadura chibensis]|uniref:Uncharacterized protein n=1 Tax=Actinomadura chibensis TaxID=392828 RepID=A0A5D0NFZ0_9ACTN|nr:hypothetical protein [Actinomadura chibensis]TYB43273.1 hypothetical protein FXF69_25900 [Actinomadura chibensis]